MSDEDINKELEAFRKALLRQAHKDFLEWARTKTEFYEEYSKSGFLVNFDDYVTEKYWGELE
jgi:hypothetical protein